MDKAAKSGAKKAQIEVDKKAGTKAVENINNNVDSGIKIINWRAWLLSFTIAALASANYISNYYFFVHKRVF